MDRTKRLAILFAVLLLVLLVAGCGGEEGAPATQTGYQVSVSLIGDEKITVGYGEAFTDPGVEAKCIDLKTGDAVDGLQVQTHGQVDTETLGTYTLTYTAEYQGVSQSVERTVEVVDITLPVIELVSDPDSYTLPGQPYQEEGFTATDDYDGDITDRVIREEKDGVVTYSVSDSSGNTAMVRRQIRYKDPVAPELVLLGETEIQVDAGDVWVEPGYTAMDDVDGDLTASVKVTGTVDRYVGGTYVIKYEVTDSSGNTATAQRTVVVRKHGQPQVVEPKGKVIYLTFDDGPWSDTDELLKVLAKYDVKATFFVVNNTKFIDLLDDIAAGGHAIGIHSKTHRYDQIYANEDAFFQDLYAMQDIIYKHTGIKSTIMRFPGGSSNGVSKKYNLGIMTRLVKAVESMGFQYFDWNVDSDDAGSADTPEEVYRNVVAGVQEKDYSVVLMHDTRGYSVDAVERIIRWGLENGYTFKALDPTSPTCHHDWIKN